MIQAIGAVVFVGVIVLAFGTICWIVLNLPPGDE